MSTEDDALISTKDHPGPFDGYAKAAPGEPIFPLLARDPEAAPLVHLWVQRRRAAAIKMPEEQAKAEYLQAMAAEMIAWRMEEWRRGQPEDQGTPLLETYSGYKPSAEAQREVDRARAVKEAHSRLQNALAEANDQIAVIERLGLHNDAALAIRAAVDMLKQAAELIAPKRPAYMTPKGASDGR